MVDAAAPGTGGLRRATAVLELRVGHRALEQLAGPSPPSTASVTEPAEIVVPGPSHRWTATRPTDLPWKVAGPAMDPAQQSGAVGLNHQAAAAAAA
jgi:hypothetical protein